MMIQPGLQEEKNLLGFLDKLYKAQSTLPFTASENKTSSVQPPKDSLREISDSVLKSVPPLGSHLN